MNKSVLVTGVSGYIGPYLCRELRKKGNLTITGLYNTHKINPEQLNLVQCDLTKFDDVTRAFDNAKPEVVYHLASVTPTRIGQQTDEYVEFFNNKVTEHIAKLCREYGSLMIYTSSDLVYNEGEDLRESTAKLNPLTIYAKSKLMGENSVWAFSKKYLILRTSLVYGFTLSSYTSFFDYAYKTLKSGESLDAFIDQFRSPIYAEDAAAILACLPEVYEKNDTINFCGDEYLSRFEMCIMMAKSFGFDMSLVKMARSSELTDYISVKKLKLSNEKLKKLGFKTDSYANNLRKSHKIIH